MLNRCFWLARHLSFRRPLFVLFLVITLALPRIYAIDPPGIINYQGMIEVDEQPFDGTGYFQFALVDAGGNILWSNDGSGSPTATVPVDVSLGRYSVRLGDTGFHANMNNAIAASVFTGSADVRLRVWFDADGGGATYPLEQLTPDQRLGSVGYALNAASAETATTASGVLDGSITSAQLADDAVIASKIADGAVTKLDSPDGSLVGVVRADNFGRVGIGPGDPLGNHVPMLKALDSVAADFTFSSPDIVVVGDYAYTGLGTGSGGANLQIFDVSDPDNIIALDSESAGIAGPYGLDVQGNFVYLLDYNFQALKVFDISNPNAITLAGEFTLDPLTYPRAVDVQGDYAYVGGQLDTAELQIFDISDPAAIVRTAQLGGSTRLSRPYDLVVRGDYLYVVDGYTRSFSIFDVSDPTNIVERGWVNTGFSIPESIALQGDFAYTVDSSQDNLRVFDISDPINIVEVGSISTVSEAPRSVAVQGVYAFVADSSGILELIDISDPTAMTTVLTESVNLDSPYALTVSGDKIYLGEGGKDFLQIYELTSGGVFLSDHMVLPAEVGVVFDDKLQSKAFGANSVTTEEIVDFGVTTADIGIDAVTRQKMANSAVGTEELGDNSVTVGKMSPTYYDSQADPLSGLSFSGSGATLSVTYDSPFPVGEFPDVSVSDGWTVVSGNSTQGFTATSDFSLFTVDGPAALPSSIDVGGHSSLAIVDGRPAIAYYDRETDVLKYSIASTADGSGAWITVEVDTGVDVGEFCSLTTSPVSGNPIISYYDASDWSNGSLKYAYGVGDGTGGFLLRVVDLVSDSGEYTSIAWVDGRPAISYYENFEEDLRFAIADDSNGLGDWTVYEVDTVGRVGRYTSLAVIDGRPAISYLDDTNNYLKYALASTVDGSGSWTTVNVDTAGDVGYETSLAIVNGYPAISYQDLGNKDLKFAIARSNDGLGSWETVVVDSQSDSRYSTSLAVVDGKPAISYFDDAAEDLRYAVSTNAFGTDSWSSVMVVDATDLVGEYSSLEYINGRAAISYYDDSAQSLNYVVLPPTPEWSSSRDGAHPIYVNAARSAQEADVAYQVADGVLTSTSFAENAVDHFALANDAVNTLNILDGSILAVDLAPGILDDFWQLSGGDIYRMNGKVGIGTASPSSLLHLASTGSVSLLLEADTNNYGEGDQPSMVFSQDNGLVQASIGFFDSKNDVSIRTFGSVESPDLILLPEGNVGVGATPDNSGDKLQVFGDLTLKNATEFGSSRISFVDDRGVNGSIESNYENGGSFEFEANYSSFAGTLGVNGYPALGGDALQVFGDIQCVALNITSDRNKKDGFESVDPLDILDRVAAMPITRWHYKSDPAVSHLGPMAQDFHTAFGVGKDDKHISTVDADGVALAAIQGLKQLVDQKDEKIDELESRIQRLESMIMNLSGAR